MRARSMESRDPLMSTKQCFTSPINASVNFIILNPLDNYNITGTP